MIYLVRHGQTLQNRAGLLQGRSDFPLNEMGREQARRVGAFFREQGVRFDAVYTSPLRRAVQTAALIAGETVPLRVDERLIEMDYGPYEGMDLRAPAPEVLAFFKDFVRTPAPEGMEPLSSVVSRMGEFLQEIRGEISGRNILVSTHAIAMKGALEYLTPDSKGSWWSRFIGNCAVFQVGLEESRVGLNENRVGLCDRVVFGLPKEWIAPDSAG